MTTSAVGGHHRRSAWWHWTCRKTISQSLWCGSVSWSFHQWVIQWPNPELPLRHGCVKQRVDNGHIMVISYHRQQRSLCSIEHPEKQMLFALCWQRRRWFASQLGSWSAFNFELQNNRWITGIHKWKAAEKKYMGVWSLGAGVGLRRSCPDSPTTMCCQSPGTIQKE